MDQGKFLKLAQRVEDTLSKETQYPDPKQLDPNHVLVSPFNRMGQPPNVQHIHFGILKSFLENSYDRTRPAVGICVEHKSQAGIQELIEHNRRFTQGNKLLPNILENHSGPWYGSLACSHLNLAFRCLKQGTVSPIGDLSETLQNPTLKEVVHSGHRWWVLKETVAKERQVDISVWRNQDQNENQQTHEMEILQTIRFAAEGFQQAGKEKISMQDLVAAAQKKNPSKVSPTSWLTLSKYYIGFLENNCVDLLEDLTDFHSACVDPKQLCVSIAFYGALESEPALKKAPHLRLYLTSTQYTSEKVKTQAAGPAISQFLETSQLTSLFKKPDQINQVEKTIRDLKAKYLPLLQQHLGNRLAKLEFMSYMDLLLRALFCKPWPEQEPRVDLGVGKFSDEKIKALGIHWATGLDLKYPSMHFASATGLIKVIPEDKEALQEVSLANLRTLKQHPSTGPEPEDPQFKVGDEVTVSKRMTVSLPQAKVNKIIIA